MVNYIISFNMYGFSIYLYFKKITLIVSIKLFIGITITRDKG